jgi:hypothetical protein
MYLILRHDATLPIFSGDSSANQSNLESSSHPSRQDVLQFQVQLNLNVPAGWRMQGYHARLQDVFLKTYKREQRFQMTLQGIGTDTWRLEGRVRLNQECKLRNARTRFKGVLMRCYEDLRLSPAENKAFSDYLGSSNVLSVKPDAEPFPGDGSTHSWTVVEPTSQPPPQPQPSAGTAGAPGAGGPAAGRRGL